MFSLILSKSPQFLEYKCDRSLEHAVIFVVYKCAVFVHRICPQCHILLSWRQSLKLNSKYAKRRWTASTERCDDWGQISPTRSWNIATSWPPRSSSTRRSLHIETFLSSKNTGIMLFRLTCLGSWVMWRIAVWAFISGLALKCSLKWRSLSKKEICQIQLTNIDCK